MDSGRCGVGRDGGFSAAVALKLRADAVDGTPLVDDIYHAEKNAAGTDLKATVEAYGAALDEIYSAFYADLRQRGTPRAG